MKARNKTQRRGKRVALYHVVYAHESYEDAAKTLHEMVLESERKFPGAERLLFLDIEGHRNNAGGFDDDMLHLQREFLIGFLAPYCTELRIPLFAYDGEYLKNSDGQENNVPKVVNYREVIQWRTRRA